MLILGLAIGTGSGFVASKIQKPVYESITKILITRASSASGSDVFSLSDYQLAQTYKEFITTKENITAASEQLGFNIDREHIQAEQIPDTQIVQLTVEDGDAQRAADIGNALVAALITQYEELQVRHFTSYEETLQTRIIEVEKQIADIQTQFSQIREEDIRKQLEKVDEEIASLQNDRATLQSEIQLLRATGTDESRNQIVEKEARIKQIETWLISYEEIRTNLQILGRPSALDANRYEPALAQMESVLENYQGIYINLVNTLETVRVSRLQNTINVTQIQKASVPNSPVRPIPLLTTVLAGLVGLIIGGGTAFLLEFTDNTLKSSEDIQQILGLPIIGMIADTPEINGFSGFSNDLSPSQFHVAEAYRSLCANLALAEREMPLKKLLVASTDYSEGTTSMAVNLAMAFASMGKRVVILDANLRQPGVQTVLNMKQEIVDKKIPDQRLRVHDSGFTQADLLSLDKMDKLLVKLQEKKDLVIIDSAPLFLADAHVLATLVDGVLMVVRPGDTLVESAQAALEQLKRVDAKVIGVVMNRIPQYLAKDEAGYRYFLQAQSGARTQRKVIGSNFLNKIQRLVPIKFRNLQK